MLIIEFEHPAEHQAFFLPFEGLRLKEYEIAALFDDEEEPHHLFAIEIIQPRHGVKIQLRFDTGWERGDLLNTIIQAARHKRPLRFFASTDVLACVQEL